MCLSELIRPTYWRNLLLAPSTKDEISRGYLSKGQIEEATDALARAFTIVLWDWFTGVRVIDFEAFRNEGRLSRFPPAYRQTDLDSMTGGAGGGKHPRLKGELWREMEAVGADLSTALTGPGPAE
jgi:hypothetical protein